MTVCIDKRSSTEEEEQRPKLRHFNLLWRVPKWWKAQEGTRTNFATEMSRKIFYLVSAILFIYCSWLSTRSIFTSSRVLQRRWKKNIWLNRNSMDPIKADPILIRSFLPYCAPLLGHCATAIIRHKSRDLTFVPQCIAEPSTLVHSDELIPGTRRGAAAGVGSAIGGVGVAEKTENGQNRNQFKRNDRKTSGLFPLIPAHP